MSITGVGGCGVSLVSAIDLLREKIRPDWKFRASPFGDAPCL